MDKDLTQYSQRFQAANENIRRKMMTDYRSMADNQGLSLTPPQFFMLHFISENEPCKITRLAEKMEVKPSAITVMIDRLVHSGLVVRNHDDVDRRAVYVKLTEEGHEVLKRVKALSHEIVGGYLSRLEEAELRQFIETFEKLAGIADKPSDKE